MSTSLPPLPLPGGVRAGYADTAQGLQMHYLEAGYEGDVTDKPLLLLLHGFPSKCKGKRGGDGSGVVQGL